MNLGFIGCGNWAQKLATAFRECGAEIVAHDRGGEAEAPGFGTRSTVQAMIHGDICDALILCAPPEVTTAVALECAKAGKRCVATKPLLWTEAPDVSGQPPDPPLHAREWSKHIRNLRQHELTKNLYVDLWRLYSPAWLAMKEELRGKKIAEVSSFFYGNGPKRTFHGALDYGPHALAHVRDMIGEFEVQSWIKHGEHLDGIWQILGQAGDVRLVDIQIGNGDTREGPQACSRYVSVKCHDGSRFQFEEQADGKHRYFNGGVKMVVDRGLALRRFCRAFMAVESSRTLEYSIAAQRVLERIIDGS